MEKYNKLLKLVKGGEFQLAKVYAELEGMDLKSLWRDIVYDNLVQSIDRRLITMHYDIGLYYEFDTFNIYFLADEYSAYSSKHDKILITGSLNLHYRLYTKNPDYEALDKHLNSAIEHHYNIIYGEVRETS